MLSLSATCRCSVAKDSFIPIQSISKRNRSWAAAAQQSQAHGSHSRQGAYPTRSPSRSPEGPYLRPRHNAHQIRNENYPSYDYPLRRSENERSRPPPGLEHKWMNRHEEGQRKPGRPEPSRKPAITAKYPLQRGENGRSRPPPGMNLKWMNHHEEGFRKPGRPEPMKRPTIIAKDQVMQYFQDHVVEWRAKPHVLQRLVSFGLDPKNAKKLLDEYVKAVKKGTVSGEKYDLERFSKPQDGTSIDVIYSTVFFSWATQPENEARFVADLGVSESTVRLVNKLTRVTSRLFPADEYGVARKTHRKIIMHVGPTNSGKTHHALRALAAARSGVYAGPLRLLAHEIWHRLNSGQIVPLGVDAQAPKNPKGDPEYARLCNMITGEEKKIAEGPTSHLSCTVEMLSQNMRYDVAVIDEIQMMGDPMRGPGWMSAVLGVWAKEIHLCGEETAVPLVEALLEHTGDDLEVRRYERLTPLVVEKESLGGDFSKIKKGDCIVAFNRSSIFANKKTVEDTTGMRCAVVYGRLPPEIRSEQAALFNDPDSGYDVIVGSDAIGMGLNLKIKRVVFSATAKYDGQALRPLDVSAVKQIAGRAGRYGLHKEQVDLGGTTTTLYDDDLPHLQYCVAQPYEPLLCVRIGFHGQCLRNIVSVLPVNTPMYTILSAAKFIGRLPSYVQYTIDDQFLEACAFVDQHWANMSIDDKLTLVHSPVPWRDPLSLEIIQKIWAQQARGDRIDFVQALRGTGLLEKLDELENKMRMEEAGLPSRAMHNANMSLMVLESMHKVIGFYLWMSFRHPLQYCEAELVTAIKVRLELVLNWALDRLSRKLVGRRGLQAIVRNEPVAKSPKVDLGALDAARTPTEGDAEILPVL